MRTRIAVIATIVLVAALATVVDLFARAANEERVRSEVSAETDAIATGLLDLLSRESAIVATLEAFVLTTAGDPQHLDEEFDTFAGSLIEQSEAIRSLQIARDTVLEYVYPLEGNEAALGLDLYELESRRRLLERARIFDQTVVEGPFELVQGGQGLVIRQPIYLSDGSFWGFGAVVFDWDALSKDRAFQVGGGQTVGLRIADTDQIIAGDPSAFEDDPVVRSLTVGTTSTVWQLAVRPEDGWPSVAPATVAIWTVAAIGALLASLLVGQAMRRPELLRAEREKAVRDLALAEVRYQSMFHHAGVGIAIFDHDGAMLSMNPYFADIVGLDPDSPMAADSMYDLVHPDDRRGMLRHIATLREGGDPFITEVRFDGAPRRWARMRVTAVPDGGRSDGLFVVVLAETTDQRLAEQRLAASELRYRQLFQNAPAAIQREDQSKAAIRLRELQDAGVTDIRAYLHEHHEVLAELLDLVQISDVNPTALAINRKLVGPDAPNQTLVERMSEDSIPPLIETLAAIAEGRSRLELTVEHTDIDGMPMTLEMRWHAPMVDGVPDYENVMVTLSDITALRLTERRLAALLETKDRFIASVAHELRTPLTAVVGFAQHLTTDFDSFDGDELKEFLTYITFHSQEMSHLIEDLLVWARTDVGEVRVVSEQLDVVEAVDKTLTMMPDVTVPVSYRDETTVFADPTRLRQIVRNLLTNAVRYGGGDIQVDIVPLHNFVAIEVSDAGPSISSDDIARIFEPYERLDATPTQPGSIGLGLTVSRTLARLQGGDLSLYRRRNRNVFRLTLPKADPTVPIPAEAGAEG